MSEPPPERSARALVLRALLGVSLLLAGAWLARRSAGPARTSEVFEGRAGLRVPLLRLRPERPRGTALLATWVPSLWLPILL